MKILRYHDAGFDQALDALVTRSAFPIEADRAAADILEEVQAEGDAAVIRYAARFDHVDLTAAQFAVSAEEIAVAATAIDDTVKAAIDLAHRNITAFAEQRRPADWSFSPRPGVTVGERFVPLSRIAAYIPGGAAPLVSTVLHTITMAQVAGVREIVVTTPPRADGSVNPAILYASKIAGATEIYRLGGVYAIGALAYGTRTILAVEKIVGPGNAYVTAAKRRVYGDVALDLVAGPSEVLVIADRSARPASVAADLLAQAEHGSGREEAVMVTTAPEMIDAVRSEVERQAADISGHNGLRQVLENGVYLILAETIDQAMAIANRYAPEHLEIQSDDAGAIATGITAAGAVFIGHWTPESCGDFVAGPSHVLPTGGTARFFSGLTVEQFYRRLSNVEYDRAALAAERSAIEAFSSMEGLTAHGRCAGIRFA